jgi:hypothetical protein
MKDGDWITPDLIAPGLSFYDAKNIFQCEVTVIWLYEMIAKVHGGKEARRMFGRMGRARDQSKS